MRFPCRTPPSSLDDIPRLICTVDPDPLSTTNCSPPRLFALHPWNNAFNLPFLRILVAVTTSSTIESAKQGPGPPQRSPRVGAKKNLIDRSLTQAIENLFAEHKHALAAIRLGGVGIAARCGGVVEIVPACAGWGAREG